MSGSRKRAKRAVPTVAEASVRQQDLEAAAPLAFDDRLAIFLAFVGSGCLLILEIVAGRLLAPTVGVSLYTWTSVIGVVLAGVSLGNFLGGRLADRRPNRSTVALIYVAASASSLAILGLVHYVESLELPNGAPAIVQVLWLNVLLFFVPSTILGAATPVLTRISLHAVEEGGRVVGRIQAAASAGSIVGTFLTGFVLISAFGTRRIVAGVALTLLLLAIAARPPWLGARVYELGSLAFVILVAGSVTHSSCLRESDYYCIKVVNVTFDVRGPSGATRKVSGYRALYLDRLLHGVSNLRDPKALYYTYERAYANAIARLHPEGSNIDTMFLGGGSYTFPRFVDAKYGGRIVVAEIDPAVTEGGPREARARQLEPNRGSQHRRAAAAAVAAERRAVRLRLRGHVQRLRGAVPPDDRRVQRPDRAAPEARRALPDERDRQRPLRLPAFGGADAAQDVPLRRRDRHGRQLAAHGGRPRDLRSRRRQAAAEQAAADRARRTTSRASSSRDGARCSRTTTLRSTSCWRRPSSRRSRTAERQSRRTVQSSSRARSRCTPRSCPRSPAVPPAMPISGIAMPSEPSASGIIGALWAGPAPPLPASSCARRSISCSIRSANWSTS